MADRSRVDKIRDHAAQRMCNVILHTIATPWYRRGVTTLLAIGEARARVLDRQMQEIQEEADRG